MGDEPAFVCVSIHTFRHEYFYNQHVHCNQILSETSLGGRTAAEGFGPDRIRTLVSTVTDDSHRVIMGKTVLPLFLSCFSSDPFHTCR